jgi:C4-dicarboxylate-binding protein DctP
MRNKKTGTKILVVLMSMSLALTLVATSWGEEPVVMRFSHIMPPNSYYGQMCAMIVKDLKGACGGRLKIEEYHSGQLHGSLQKSVEACSAGEIQMCFVNNNVLASYDRRFDLYNAPGVIGSWEHLKRFQKTDIAKDIKDNLVKKQNILLLAWSGRAGKINIWTTRKPIKSIEDWKGIKIRSIPHQPSISMIKSLGGSPIVVDMGEVSAALSQGIIDGVMTNPLSAVSAYQGLHVLPYCTDYDPIWAGPQDAMITFPVNAKWWNEQVPDDLKKIILAQYAETSEKLEQMFRDGVSDSIKKYKEAKNCTIYTLTEKETLRWKKIVDEEVIPKLEKTYGPEFFKAAKAAK